MKLWHILVLAIVVRTALYLGLNVFFFGGELEHPDSQVYHEGALIVQQLWTEGHQELLPYPEYSNVVALLYHIFGPNRYGPEGLNILLSLLNVVLGYKIIERYGGSKRVAAFLLAIDPYMAYLSTQYLRDTLLLTGTLVMMYGIARRELTLPFIGLILTGWLRFKLGIALAIPLLGYSITSKRFTTAVSLALGAVILWSIYSPYRAGGSFSSLTQIEIVESSAKVHREFFDSGFNPNASRFTLIDLASRPYFWTADNPTEYMFGIYMVYYMGVLILFAIGGFTLSKNRYEFLVFTTIILVLGYILAHGTVSMNPLLRWRLPLFILVILGVGLVTNWKRVLDLAIGLVLIMLLALPALIISIALISSEQKVIFSQRRVGYKRKEFTIYKFTSMIPESDYNIGDKHLRITLIGKIIRPFALDEIPQLWNLFRGQMSLVGPRPLALWDQKDIEGWDRRHNVKPGFTGPSQLGSDKDNIEGKFKLDLEYAESEPDLWKDLKLILKGMHQALLRSW